jgi:predicted small lipoprotein YifL
MRNVVYAILYDPHAEERRLTPARLEARTPPPPTIGTAPVSRTASIALLLALSVGLPACGKKGDPEYPAGTPMETVKKPDGGTEKRPKKSTRPFVLDGLLN